MATDREILTIFSMLRANYLYAFKDMCAEELSNLQLLWCELLRDIDGDVLKAAALQYASGPEKWPPTAGQLRAIAFTIMHGDRETAMEAWGEVVSQIRTVGYYNKPNFTNPITRRLVKEMGWRNLCLSEYFIADRARFIEAYNQLAAREKSAVMELPIVSEVRRQIQAVTEGRRIEAPIGFEVIESR